MTTRNLLTCGIVICCLAIIPIIAADQPCGRSEVGDVTHETANQIERVLRQSSECAFDNTPLEEVCALLQDRHQIPIWIDKQALQDEGISTDTQISLTMPRVTLETILKLAFEPLALTYLIEDGVLKITTQSKSEEKQTARFYPVADLIESNDYRTLLNLIVNLTYGRWMERDGEGGSIVPYPNARTIVICQSRRVHREIEGILAALRKAKDCPDLISIPANPDQPDGLSSGRRTRSNSVQAWQHPRIHTAE